MKFLVITRMKTNPPPIPPAQRLAMTKAALVWLNEQQNAGKIDCVYSFVPSGGVAISNADSHEEVYQMTLAYPLFPLFDWEILPLADVNKTFPMVVAALEKMG